MNRIQKILFLNPPDLSLMKDDSSHYSYFEAPLGLLYVYSFMKNRGDVEVKFIDLNIEMKFVSKTSFSATVEKVLYDIEPDLIAISTLYYNSIHIFHLLAKTIKQIDFKIPIVFGGHYPTHLTEKCLSDNNVDYAILSEGELGFADLIDALNGKNKLIDVEGIAFKNNGVIVKNTRKKFWVGFSDVLRLPWEDVKFSYYFQEGRNILHRVKRKEEIIPAAMTATRGCPNQCEFCSSSSFWQRRWRKRKISNIIDEITYLQNNYGVNTIIFNDENISVHKKWFIEFLDELKKLDIIWISSGGLSVRTLNDKEVVQKMCDSGIGLFNLAIESGSNDTLKRIRKPITYEEAESVIQLIRKYSDVFINAFFIVGFPFEDLAGVKHTLQFAESLDLDWRSFYCFQPFPGTELYNYCKENNLIEEFDINYGEVYAAPEMKHIDYTSEQLNQLNYLANLKCNFLQNRNLRLKTEKSLAQAERDFLYVLEMVPDHVFAYLGLAEIMRLRNKMQTRKEYILKAKLIVDKNKFDWNFYLSELGIDIVKLYEEIA